MQRSGHGRCPRGECVCEYCAGVDRRMERDRARKRDKTAAGAAGAAGEAREVGADRNGSPRYPYRSEHSFLDVIGIL